MSNFDSCCLKNFDVNGFDNPFSKASSKTAAVRPLAPNLK